MCLQILFDTTLCWCKGCHYRLINYKLIEQMTNIIRNSLTVEQTAKREGQLSCSCAFCCRTKDRESVEIGTARQSAEELAGDNGRWVSALSPDVPIKRTRIAPAESPDSQRNTELRRCQINFDSFQWSE